MLESKLLVVEIDALKIKIYDEFYKQNRELYFRDMLEFCRQQNKYCEMKMQKYMTMPLEEMRREISHLKKGL